jgi:hypothetical protein
MYGTLLLIIFFLICQIALAQTALNGVVVDEKNTVIPGASVILIGTFKGTVTDSTGHFSLDNITPKDTLRLKISSLGFNPEEKIILYGSLRNLIIVVLKEQVSILQDVIISAGSFEASDEKKSTILKPFDIATIPTASPDAFKGVEQLPGTSKVGEREGLFVRGGDANETKAVIDGMIVQDPFFSSVPGVAQKGRFSPLMFKGTSFSTGGYSAQYGQALSSVLLLKSQDVAQASSSTIVLSTPGIVGNLTRKWDNTSLALNANYQNLKPSFYINKQNFDYDHAPEGGGGNIIFRAQGKKDGLFKLYTSYQLNNVSLRIHNPSLAGDDVRYRLDNKNLYVNSTYSLPVSNWVLNTGISFSRNNDDVIYDSLNITNGNSRSQGRVVLVSSLGKRTEFYIGSELQYVHYRNSANPSNYALDDLLIGNFIEMEFYAGNKIAARVGLRNEVSNTLNSTNLAPRLSVAYVFNPYAQISACYGNFYQLPAETYLFTNQALKFEKASHYIINYQVVKNDRTFRIEAYYKDYRNLVKEPANEVYQPFVYGRIASGDTNNDGIGYAKGIDLFWYDRTSIRRLDYWLSYSYLDTKRFYQNYPVEAMPPFAAHHNASVVVKYSIPKTTFNLGFTYNFTSGRPYYNPSHQFLTDKTPAMHNLIFSGNYSWFYKTNLIALFAYVDNILGIKNIYGYYFSQDGTQRYTITPPAYRSIYAGINITLAKRKTIMGINF